ncbi:MAG: hypothetical protein DRH26_02010 [Deltaproteobacteria bacterium]|nr:MAG: hypothetical protein DRH26_02010 [Deltaproteobacteria bacterium]
MVILKDLFNLLATGEFSGIALSHASTGGLNEKEYEKVINHINLGILEIYKRFKLLENAVTIHTDPSVTRYYLRPDRLAILEDIDTTTYIVQPEDTEGVLNIIEVNAVCDSTGEELILNNRFLTPSISQIASDTLEIIGLEAAEIFTVFYQSFPTKIVIASDFDPAEYILYIPETIVEPLMYYVAARVYKPIGKNDSTANADKSAGYQQDYELACTKLSMYGLEIQDDNKDNTFEDKGWA